MIPASQPACVLVRDQAAMNCGRSAGTIEYPARPRISAPHTAATMAAEGPTGTDLAELTAHHFESIVAGLGTKEAGCFHYIKAAIGHQATRQRHRPPCRAGPASGQGRATGRGPIVEVAADKGTWSVCGTSRSCKLLLRLSARCQKADVAQLLSRLPEPPHNGCGLLPPS